MTSRQWRWTLDSVEQDGEDEADGAEELPRGGLPTEAVSGHQEAQY